MGELNLGRVVGNTWYVGTGITGSSTSPTVYEDSGVEYALTEDMYLNSVGANTPNPYRGNVYKCVTGGAPDVAEWVFVGTIVGPQVEVINNLESTDTAKALSANMGRKLKEILDTAGIQPYVVTPTYGGLVYTASVVIEDLDTTFTVTDDAGNEGEYEYEGTELPRATVNITIGTSIGLPENGAVISKIRSSDAHIFSYTLYDEYGNEVFAEEPSIWEHMANDELNIVPGASITEGENAYKSGIISKIINNVRTTLYPVTHAKAVYFNKTKNQTLYDEMLEFINENVWYGTCSTTADVVQKDALTTYAKNTTLATGQKVRIKFTYDNTASAPTLRVDNLTAKPIVAYGVTTPSFSWKAGDIVDFTYDGTSWVMGASAGLMEAIASAQSHVGMIIHSTTLDTEAKVIAQYGGTAWIQHSGYVLRGASSGVVADSAVKTGGSDDAIIPYHNHSVSKVTSGITGGAHQHRTSSVALAANTSNIGFIGDGIARANHTFDNYHDRDNTNSVTHTHDLPAHNTNYAGTSGNTVNANIPNYKSVYIWERTA